MKTSALPYPVWIDRALRDVIRKALAYVADFGLPEPHHFYITFRTDADGVEISPRVRAQHSEEMTIVLQHQFWNLAVDEEAFSVTLKFGGRRDHLRVPFEAMTAFADPGVNFGLQFKQTPAPDDEAKDEADDEAEDRAAQPEDTGPEDTGKEAPADGGSGSVIPLDTFRKK